MKSDWARIVLAESSLLGPEVARKKRCLYADVTPRFILLTSVQTFLAENLSAFAPICFRPDLVQCQIDRLHTIKLGKAFTHRNMFRLCV